MDELLKAIISLQIMAMKQVREYPATYRAVNVLTKIAGWERVAKAGDTSFDLGKKTKQIYQEQADRLRGCR